MTKSGPVDERNRAVAERRVEMMQRIRDGADAEEEVRKQATWLLELLTPEERATVSRQYEETGVHLRFAELTENLGDQGTALAA